MIKVTIHQEDMIVNLNSLNIKVPNFIKPTLLDIKGEIGSNTIIVGGLDTLFLPRDRAPRQKKYQQ